MGQSAPLNIRATTHGTHDKNLDTPHDKKKIHKTVVDVYGKDTLHETRRGKTRKDTKKANRGLDNGCIYLRNKKNTPKPN